MIYDILREKKTDF